MISYIIQTLIFQAVFFFIYEFLLKKETLFKENRLYLIVSQGIVLLLPFVYFPSIQKQMPVVLTNTYEEVTLNINRVTSLETLPFQSNAFSFRLEWLLFLGMFIALCLFLFKIFRLFKQIVKRETISIEGGKLVLLPESTNAFSFFNIIFLGEGISKEKQREIINHELIHIKQRHSLDLLFFELLRIVCWFNPFVYLYQKRVTELHEFLVDEAMVYKDDMDSYTQSILNTIFQTKGVSFTNEYFKSSLIKKRIQMMHKTKSSKRKQFNYLVVIPICLAAIIYISCTKADSNSVEENSLVISEFRTGDIPECLGIEPIFDKKIDNYLSIKNDKEGRELDAVVTLVKEGKAKGEGTPIRRVFVEKNTSYTMKNIPEGIYYIEINSGNEWVEKTNTDGTCTGEFRKDAKYKKESILDFNIIKTPNGFEVPNYEVTLED